MKITQIETLQADAGWRMFSFLKVTTSDGIVGWSEFNESFGSTGLSDVIKGLAPHVDRTRPASVRGGHPAFARSDTAVARRVEPASDRGDRECPAGCGGEGLRGARGRTVWRADPRADSGLLVAFRNVSGAQRGADGSAGTAFDTTTWRRMPSRCGTADFER